MERFGNEATADGALEAAALLHATHLSGAAPRVVLPPDCLAAIESRLLEGRVSPTLFADAAGAILSRMLDAIPILHDPDGSHEALSAEHAGVRLFARLVLGWSDLRLAPGTGL